MTQKSKQIRAVALAALMVLSVFAGTIAFTGSAAAAVDAESIDIGAGYGSQVTVEDGSSAVLTGVQVNDSDNNYGNYTVWVDTNGDGYWNSSEPSAQNTQSSVTQQSNIDIGDINVSDLSADTYDVAAAENATVGSENDTFVSGQLKIVSSSAPKFNSAIHYDNDTTKDGVDAELELAFNEDVTADSVTVLDSDNNVVASSMDNADSANGRVVVTLDNGVNTSDLKVKYKVTDSSGNVAQITENENAKDVTFASTTVRANNPNAYKGSKVAIVANTTDSDVEIDGENNYAFSGSTGTNSKVFVFDTKNRALGEYNATFDSATRTIDVRDLGLSLSVDSQNVTTADGVSGTVSAHAGNRPVTLQLYESDGDEYGAAVDADLNGQGDYEFDIDISDTGSYTLEVTDDYSGVTNESSTINVKKAGEGKASFGSSVVTEERGDVVEIPVTLSNTDEATVNVGSSDVGFHANVTVEDGNDDDKVTLLFNTWAAQGGVDDAFSVEGDEDEITTDAQIIGGDSVNSLLDAGDYDLEVRTAGASSSQNVATLVLEERSTSAVTTWTTSDNTDISDIDALNEAFANRNITQDSEIVDGDRVITQVNASGLAGIYENQGADDAAFLDNENFSFSVNQTSAPANRDPFWLNLTAENTDVIADAENDTYYVVFTTGDDSNVDAIREVNGSDVGFGAEDGLTANFTVAKDEGYLADSQESAETNFELVEGEHSLDEPVNVSNAASQTIEGESNVAPGTELQIRVRSSENTRPSFLKTATVSVTENNTFAADFDFSNQNVGDKFTVRVTGGAAGDLTDVKGNVVEGSNTTTETVTDNGTVTTQGPTETATTDAPATTTAAPTTAGTTDEPATDESTDTSTPGFGVVVAVTALLAAALLAVRRD